MPVAVATLAATPLADAPVAAEVSVAAAANGEVRKRPCILLTFRTRKRRADQRAVDGAILDLRRGVGLRIVSSAILVNGKLVLPFGRFRLTLAAGSLFHRVLLGIGKRLAELGCGGGNSEDRCWILVRNPSKHLAVECSGGILPFAPRCFAAFVGVLGVTGRATRLLDVVFDHRDDGVVRHTPLARTVVVQYVTETQPALLH
jgi:hypothetical protein